MNLWFFKFEKDRKPNDLDEIWKLAEQAIHGQLTEDSFRKVLSMPGIGIAKLSQGLFWLNPEVFYPVDSHKTYLHLKQIDTTVNTLENYLAIIQNTKSTFVKPLYEVSHDAYMNSQIINEKDEDEVTISAPSFHNRKNQYEPEKFKKYLEFIQSIVRDFQLQSDDPRIVFTSRNRRLNFIIGQRYCLNLYRNSNPNIIGFISARELDETTESFSGPTIAYYNETEEIDALEQYREEITDALKVELARSKKSGYLDKDDPEFRNAIFGLTSDDSETKIQAKIKAHNIILYGPPGTGKTYSTIEKAISIVNPDYLKSNYSSQLILQSKFKELLIRDLGSGEGQIAFCTFHQSFSYEDFVEGIKPITPESSEMPLHFEVVDGIFKKICLFASADLNVQELSQQKDSLLTSSEFEKGNFYKISLGDSREESGAELYNYCVQNNFIAIGYGGKHDYSGMDDDTISTYVEEKKLKPFAADAIIRFKNKLNVGDYVIVSHGTNFVKAFGIVTGEYEYIEDSEIHVRHFRKVNWIFKDLKIPVSEVYAKKFSMQTIYSLNHELLLKSFFVRTQNKSNVQVSNKNYVLIIDEINRGNVSSIFGELITLIESNKRSGSSEALETILPYSKERFSVPSNLYIIGTMNTADRSVEALDAALRRRFSFIEMPPLYHLPGMDQQVAGLRLKDILYTINMRIEKLLDKDHLIGHSYFLFQPDSAFEEQLLSAFYNNIIPLLQEYFFGDYGKIGLVLGNGFVRLRPSDKDKKLFADFQYDDLEILQERKVYEIIDYRNPAMLNGQTFEHALQLLMTNGHYVQE